MRVIKVLITLIKVVITYINVIKLNNILILLALPLRMANWRGWGGEWGRGGGGGDGLECFCKCKLWTCNNGMTASFLFLLSVGSPILDEFLV